MPEARGDRDEQVMVARGSESQGFGEPGPAGAYAAVTGGGQPPGGVIQGG